MDDELRRLEQRWLSSGARGDEANFLRRRLQVGSLERSPLELASWFHQPAAQALGASIPEDFEAWTEGLSGALEREPEIRVRVQIALGRYFLERNRVSLAEPEADRILELLEAREENLLCPCRRHQRSLARLRELAHAEISRHMSSLKPIAVLLRLVEGRVVWTELLALGGVAEFRAALRLEVLPWVLRGGYPVAERAASRRDWVP